MAGIILFIGVMLFSFMAMADSDKANKYIEDNFKGGQDE